MVWGAGLAGRLTPERKAGGRGEKLTPWGKWE